MAFWWALFVLGFAYAVCRFLLMLIPPNVPSIEVDASDVLDDGNQTQDNSFIYVPPRGRTPQAETKVQCYEPATMKYLGYFPALTPVEVSQIVVRAVLQSSGQNCAGAERFYVHEKIYSSFVSQVSKIVKSVSARR